MSRIGSKVVVDLRCRKRLELHCLRSGELSGLYKEHASLRDSHLRCAGGSAR